MRYPVSMVAFISPGSASDFPPLDSALTEPDGLLAMGGDLTSERLLQAYRRGIFPWYSSDDPILWWSPDPRAVLFPEGLHVSRRLARELKQAPFRPTVDVAFEEVMQACAEPREELDEDEEEGDHTWIVPEMITAYCALHRLGHAHSLEVWYGDELAGGVYGVSLGKVFFGESMFSRYTGASKHAMFYLCQRLQTLGVRVLDCQVESEHVLSLGAELISRTRFVELLETHCDAPAPTPSQWQAPFA